MNEPMKATKFAVQWREHPYSAYTVIHCETPAEQTELIRSLLVEDGIVAEPAKVAYEYDGGWLRVVRTGIVFDLIGTLADGTIDYLHVRDLTRLLSPKLTDDDLHEGAERCYRGHWVDIALNAHRVLKTLRDAPPSDAETQLEHAQDEAVEILAGIRGHGPNRQPCSDCRTRKAATANATAQQGSAA